MDRIEFSVKKLFCNIEKNNKYEQLFFSSSYALGGGLPVIKIRYLLIDDYNGISYNS